jgi:hypothetical protein
MKDEHATERSEPVPQHRARLDDPGSPATMAAREAAERFAIEAARRRLTSDDRDHGAG